MLNQSLNKFVQLARWFRLLFMHGYLIKISMDNFDGSHAIFYDEFIRRFKA